MADATVGHRRALEPSPLRFGTILFLASELLFFGGLFAAYFTLRAGTTPWPPPDVELGLAITALGTAFLIVSSFTFQAGVSSAGRGDLRGLRRWVAVSFLLGAAFLSIELYDWSRLAFSVSTHAYGTMYYAMTGFHGLHVIAGLALMAVVVGRAAQGAYRDGRIDGLESVAYYWHFVDVVWIALFATIFLLR
ncbi:MAG: heme-copper oxidase subunit III [Actinomycetota bacterium]